MLDLHPSLLLCPITKNYHLDEYNEYSMSWGVRFY